MATVVRPATKEDSAAVAALMQTMHAESSFANLPFDLGRLLDVANDFVTNPNRALFLAVTDGVPVGIYAGQVAKYYFSHDLVASDAAWFVVKAARGGTIGIRLLKAFEDWARSKGAVETRIGFSTNINPEAFGSLMRKLGYDNVGANYRMEITA